MIIATDPFWEKKYFANKKENNQMVMNWKFDRKRELQICCTHNVLVLRIRFCCQRKHNFNHLSANRIFTDRINVVLSDYFGFCRSELQKFFLLEVKL